MIQFRRTPSLIRKWYPSLTWERQSENAIYLTFDDGPDPEITPWVQEQLRLVDAKATFFCVGKNVKECPEIAQDLVNNGHRLGNHTEHHLNGWKTSDETYLEDIQEAEECIQRIDNQVVKLFRPPYGRIKRSQIRILQDQYEVVMWSHLSWDFASKVDCDKTIKKLKKVQPGSIIVFHDSEKAFDNLQKILPELLSFYSEKGFKLKTL